MQAKKPDVGKERVDFGKLIIISQLGEGQFGQVFLVQHEQTRLP